MEVLRVALIGANGRMGQAVVKAAHEQTAVEIVAQCEHGDALEDRIADCDVVVDFSHADAVERNCAACVAPRRPLVIGTTGHSPEQQGFIQTAARSVPIVLAPNFSVGVNTLFWLARRAAEMLGNDFDIEIVEMHHRWKKDAPSGTAKKLTQILGDARKLDLAKLPRHGREGMIGERPGAEIGVHSIRGGDVVGDHTVIFAAPGERLELTHRATSRATFAAGALRAARWIVGKAPGVYSMEDVLGLWSP